MAQLGTSDGSLSMVSYRDPNVAETLDVYDGAAKYLLDELEEGQLTSKEITRAIIGCIGSIDGSALPPRSAGWISFRRYFSNSSVKRRQNWRDGILRANKEDFDDFATKLSQWKNTSIAVVASESAIQEANENFGLDLELLNVEID